MPNIKTRFFANTTFFFLVYALVFYVIVRAFHIAMTHDEAYSFYNVKHFWYVETLCTGNTHWFNFLAIKTAVLFGLEKASQLRWFSLFSSGIFLTCAYFWIKHIKDISIKIVAFSFALLNPYLIDYLSLARGYSTGLMFEALCIICFCLLGSRNKSRLTFLSLVFSGMSAIANFNFFYFFVAFSFIYFYKHYFHAGIKSFKTRHFYIDLLFTVGIVILVLKALRFITLCSNDIGAYGGQNLIDSVFYGFIDTFIYRNFTVSVMIGSVASYGLFGLLILASCLGIYHQKKHQIVWYSISSQLFLIIVGLLVFNKISFQTLYPTYRTTLFLYPLISLVLIGFLSFITLKVKWKSMVCYVFSGLLFVNFIFSMSYTKLFDYSEQADSKIAFEYLDNLQAKKVGIDPFLYGVYRNYYQQTDDFKFKFNGDCLNMFEVSRPNYGNNKLTDFDYLILYPPYNLKYYYGNRVKLQGVKFFDKTGALLVKVLKEN